MGYSDRMDPSALTADASARIRTLLAGEGIDDSYLAFVARHLTEPDPGWRWCCGSNCDPCVARLGRVVDGARRLLGIAAQGLPANDAWA